MYFDAHELLPYGMHEVHLQLRLTLSGEHLSESAFQQEYVLENSCMAVPNIIYDWIELTRLALWSPRSKIVSVNSILNELDFRRRSLGILWLS